MNDFRQDYHCSLGKKSSAPSDKRMSSPADDNDKAFGDGHLQNGFGQSEQAVLMETMIDFLDLSDRKEDPVGFSSRQQDVLDRAVPRSAIRFSTVREELSFSEPEGRLSGNEETSLFEQSEAFPAADKSSRVDRSADEAQKIYESIVAYLKDTFSGSREENISIDRACSLILAIVNCSASRDEWYKTVSTVSYSLDSKDFLLFHHANVAIFTVCLGMTLELSRDELCRLGICALFHDIGKMLVPDEILFKRERLSPEEWKVLRNYPYESCKILSSLGSRFDIAAQCALQVNERIDGSGFPRGLEAQSINGYAQVIGLVDVYEAMTSNRPYRPKLLHYDAVKEILKTRKASFARNYITALLKTFSIFPLHSCVKLSSGVMGRIVEVNKNFPMRPKVEVLYDAGGVRVAVPFVIDLATQSFLYIEAPLPESELPATK